MLVEPSARVLRKRSPATRVELTLTAMCNEYKCYYLQWVDVYRYRLSDTSGKYSGNVSLI